MVVRMRTVMAAGLIAGLTCVLFALSLFLQNYIFADDKNSKNLCLCRNFAINYQAKIIMTIKMILIIIITKKKMIKNNNK